MVVEDIKLMAQNKGIRIHQYIPPNLSPITQTLVATCQALSWIVNMDKPELEPKHIFDFIDYQFDLKEVKVRHSLECWQMLKLKILHLKSDG